MNNSTSCHRVYSPVDKVAHSHDGYNSCSFYDSSQSYMKERTCFSWLKYGIFTASIVFIVVGGLLLAIGIWLRSDSRFRGFLSERYRHAVNEAFWEAPTLYAFSYIIIVLGCSMIVVAFFGCCGVNAGNRILLLIFAISILLLLVATLGSGLYLFYKKDGINVELSDALNYMVQHYYQGPGIVQETLDHLQTTFRCCGNSGCSDFRAFRQDPPRSCDIRCDGCHYRIWIALAIGFSIILVVFFAVFICQVIALAFTFYILFTNWERVREIYAHQEGYRRPKMNLTSRALQIHNQPYNTRSDTNFKHY